MSTRTRKSKAHNASLAIGGAGAFTYGSGKYVRHHTKIPAVQLFGHKFKVPEAGWMKRIGTAQRMEKYGKRAMMVGAGLKAADLYANSNMKSAKKLRKWARSK